MKFECVDLAKKIRDEVKNEVISKKDKLKLIVITIGDDEASKVYVKGKIKASDEVGIICENIKFSDDVDQEEVVNKIEELNSDENVTGIIVQLPIPAGFDEKEIINTIDPNKDVDGLTTLNVGKLYSGEEGLRPCTPEGILEIIKENNYDLEGKRAVVVGRSRLVGEPIAKLLQNENATVTICHSKTENLEKICKEADVLIVAMGRAKNIGENHIKKDTFVIDVGINRVDGKLCGDVDFDEVEDIASIITPVPKGVGPMTIAMLLKNTLKAYELQRNEKTLI